MKWFYILLLIGAALAIGRIVLSLRKLKNLNNDDWDSRLVERLRRSGVDPFKPQELDFFVALPTEAAVGVVEQRLSTRGFTVDSRAVADSPSQPFSVHARKAMQLSVSEVRAVSAMLKQLAEEQGGRYDGWAASKPAASSHVEE